MWHTSTGSLLLIELDPMLEVTEMNSFPPASRVISQTWRGRSAQHGMLVCMADFDDSVSEFHSP